MKGYANRFAKIDLTTLTVEDYPISDEYKKLYLGGKVLAARILYDMLQEKTDAFSPQNPIVITTSPLTCSNAPSTSRFNVSTVSPLTGLMTSSNCGGTFGIHLKKSGYDGLIIIGKAEHPIYIKIKDGSIEFCDATALWGKLTGETQELIGGKNDGKFVIGPAGENLVRYAGVVSQERIAGRNGVGAVFGSKNLKAITATGTFKPEIDHPEKLKELTKKWVKALRAHPLTGKQLPAYGTAGLITTMNFKNLLATRNYKDGRYEDFEKISGETLKEKYLVKNKGCLTCPIQCGRVVKVEGKDVKGPEVETVTLLGSNLLNNDMQKILDANYYCDEYGIDTISFGSSVGFAMELNEKGLWDCNLNFGDPNLDLVSLVKAVSYREGIGAEIAEGTRKMSEKFGGKEFAINVKGLELAAYEPRAAQGMGLGYATANRGGCHLNGGYLVVLEGLGLNVNGMTTTGKAAFSIFFQDFMEAISAGGSCLFTSYAVLPGYAVANPNNKIVRAVTKILPYFGWAIALAHKHLGILAVNIEGMVPYPVAINYVTGMKLKMGDFLKIGERGYNLERIINLRQGLSADQDTLPKRLLEEPQQSNKAVVRLAKMKQAYYNIRGWKQGIPTEKLKRKLKI
ncbi:MAG: aldehyde ferredoxin oxidoreductase family protein [Clostridia bacterium]|nr:aldehyde ferredoxin oxidoreductase family protein [Clostridia bacterium]